MAIASTLESIKLAPIKWHPSHPNTFWFGWFKIKIACMFDFLQIRHKSNFIGFKMDRGVYTKMSHSSVSSDILHPI